MPHLILLGDSVFDNAAYTGGGPDVVSQLCKIVPDAWAVTLLAVDGATTADIAEQVAALPADATYLVLCVGGNNALMEISVLDLPASSTAEAVELLADLALKFEGDYRAAVAQCLRFRLPLAVCTIYNGCFPDVDYQRLVSTALMVFNDAILRVAIEHRLPVIDLRAVCSSAEDYANPIEPSAVGGEKIARAIARLVTGCDTFGESTRIVTS